MIYPKTYEEKIGFDKIRQLLKEQCNGVIGHGFVDKIRFFDRFDVVHKLVNQTEEFRKILVSGQPFPDAYFLDMSQALQKARIENTYLTEDEVFALKNSLQTVLNCLLFFKKTDQNYPFLQELSGGVSLDANLLKDIEKIIDEKGKIKDSASPELRHIRSKILSEQSTLRKKLDQILRNLKQQGIVNEDITLTIRENRMVIPIPVEYKRRVKGFVHDTSATGQTIFVEPEEILEMNNEIRELEYEEKREIIKILTKITDRIRPEVEALEKAYHFLGMIDFIRAKARFALKINAILPQYEKKTQLLWYKAKHPLLFLSFKAQNREIVPLTIRLDEQNRILLISGPNAGGKSVCLKTVGLVQYMWQAGLLVPVAEGSQMGFFQTLCLDIGDDQSLENDLSTYSSHLKNMKHFLQFADNKALCLIDEFGTGTDPQYGGTIAEAILEALHQKNTFAVITTHYTNLKVFAQNTEGVINGAMRYDMEKLEPLFELEIGLPGSSFALEIAQKIGLPKYVVQNAREKLGDEKVSMEKILRQLEAEKTQAAQTQQQNQKLQKELSQNLEKYQHLKNDLEVNRKELLRKAKEEARKLVEEANKKIENTIRQIKENNAEKESTKQARQQIEELKVQLQEKEVPKARIVEEKGEIAAGDFVKFKDSETVAQVVEIKGKEALVSIGELRSTVKMNRLVRISKKDFLQTAPERKSGVSRSLDLVEKMQKFSSELDLRGKRGEEAIQELDRFMDDAILLSHHQLRVVHGKGDGILRSLVRQQLKTYKQVVSVQDEHADFGGAGVTIITLG